MNKKYYLLLVLINFLLSGISKQGQAFEFFLLAEYEMIENNFKSADKFYKKALSIYPNSPTILQSLVDLKSYQGEYLQAIKYYSLKALLYDQVPNYS